MGLWGEVTLTTWRERVCWWGAKWVKMKGFESVSEQNNMLVHSE